MTIEAEKIIVCNSCSNHESGKIDLIKPGQETNIRTVSYNSWLEISSDVHICAKCFFILMGANATGLMNRVVELYKEFYTYREYEQD